MTATEAAATDPLLRVEHLSVEFPAPSGLKVHAVTDVSLELFEGETLGLVGESGCGKSTTARSIMQLPPPTSGSVWFEGIDLTRLSGADMRRVRPRLQMIFQDPVSSLNPRRSVADIIGEPLATWHIGSKKDRQARVEELMDAVGLDYGRVGRRRRRAFSGGQCQRVSIARALALDPKLLICDEAVSALDVSVQAQILNLLETTKERYRLTLIFVAHDLAVVKRVSDRVAVMYLGRLCEVAPADELYRAPAHHYTAALLEAIPSPTPAPPAQSRTGLTGEPPSATEPPSGCRFRTRCPRAEARCVEEVPELRAVGPGHLVACHFPLASGVPVAFAGRSVAGPDTAPTVANGEV